MSVSIFTIPARNDIPSYKFRVTLSGVNYTLSFRYNGRMNRYILDINDASNNQILSGIPLLTQRSLIGQYRTLAVPVGVPFITDDTGKQTQPTQYSFGVDHTFWYVDPTQ